MSAIYNNSKIVCNTVYFDVYLNDVYLTSPTKHVGPVENASHTLLALVCNHHLMKLFIKLETVELVDQLLRDRMNS